MNMKKLLSVLALGAAFASGNVLAWGNDGHRAVGAIADQLLKGSAAQAQVAKLLLPGESLEKIANWPDCVKGTYCGPQSPEMLTYVAANPKHGEYHYTNVPFQNAHYHDHGVGTADDDIVQTKIANWPDCVKGTYCGPQSPEMLSYVAANPKHGEYHYTNVPFQNAHYHDHGVGTADDDIVQTLKQAILVLQGKADAASNPHGFSQREALILITHLVGDIHQPLHVGNAFVGKDGQFFVPATQAQIDDVTIFNARGGNDLLLDDAKMTALSDAVIPAQLPDEAISTSLCMWAMRFSARMASFSCPPRRHRSMTSPFSMRAVAMTCCSTMRR